MDIIVEKRLISSHIKLSENPIETTKKKNNIFTRLIEKNRLFISPFIHFPRVIMIKVNEIYTFKNILPTFYIIEFARASGKSVVYTKKKRKGNHKNGSYWKIIIEKAFIS